MNRKNLKLLADYLMALPEDYQHFEMETFDSREEEPISVTPHTCGTTGCAIGHAPYVAGLPKANDYECWDEYSERIFELVCGGEAWIWCFDCSWVDIDNTPHGAAKRIYWLLEHGLPDDWEEQMFGNRKLCYV